MSYRPIITNRDEFIAFRKHLGLTQTEMGERVGMSLRQIQDIENGRAELRPIHIMAAERAAMAFTVQTYDKGKANLHDDPHFAAALDHDQAAAMICGDGLTGYDALTGRDLKKLVAKVWTIGAGYKPVIRWYFRTPK